MTTDDPYSARPTRRDIKFQCFTLTVAALLAPALVTGQNAPKAAQTSGLARIEHVRDTMRRAGFQPALLNELAVAEQELQAGYQAFRYASDEAEAAACLVGMGDAERMDRVFLQSMSKGDANAQLDALERTARSHYEEGAQLARKTRSATSLVKALTGLVLLDEARHDYGSANSDVTEAVRAASSCPNQDCLLDALLSKVEVETYRGELFSAASHVNGVIALLKNRSDPKRQYSAYSDRADIYRAMTEGCSYNQQKSIDVCLRLFELSRADMNKAVEIASQASFTNFAQVVAQQAKQLDFLRTLAENYNSMATKVVQTVRFEPKTPKDVLATEIMPIGQIPPAEVQAMKTLSEAAGSGSGGSLTAWVNAQMEDMQGRPDAALQGYLNAIHMVEEDRRKLGEDSARASFLDDKISLYERPIILLLAQKRYSEAFHLLELSRARATADLLSTKSAGLSRAVDRQLFATLARKRAEITSIQTQFFNESLSFQSDGSDNPEAVAEAQIHLAELEANYEQALVRVSRQSSGVRDVAVSEPASLEQLQELLRQDQMDLLYYYLTDTAVILIHVGPSSVHVRNVFLPRLALITKVAVLRASMSKRDAEFRDDVSKQLFLYLIQPALAWLSSERLVIVPQGDLQSFPFQAFMNPADGSYLGERFQISYAPSASILIKMKKQRNLGGGMLLAAADPSLPGAPEEVRTLGALYANKPKVISDTLIRKADLERWAGSYNIVHLAVHGTFDSQEPLLSNVKLAGGDGEEGDLTAAEMFGLTLEQAEIVTLSACETGRVRTTRANEIQGIQQALLFAGAQSLLVSAWKVDSEATSLWMQTFYREAQSRSPAEAARDAIRAVRTNPKYTHPFYWAPFFLIAR
ncbi:MAG TPA: CHAT domain-containing protein [Candidatus Acidoferrum sp.]